MVTPTFPGFSSPAAGPEAPLEMLAACHTRVERQCQTLQRLQAHLPAHGADADAQQAATAVLRYFDTAARHHHEDEEKDLFPALLQAGADGDAAAIRTLVGTLLSDHRDLTALWARLRPALQAIAQGRSATLTAEEVAAFVDRYQAHITCEDNELLPLATRCLDEAALQRVGQAMRARRGL